VSRCEIVWLGAGRRLRSSSLRRLIVRGGAIGCVRIFWSSFMHCLARITLRCVCVLVVAATSGSAQAKGPARVRIDALMQTSDPPDLALGSESAPVTVVEYSSLACGHCAQFAKDVWPGFRARYVDTGKVRFVFRDFPLGDAALGAAMLVRCAATDKQLPLMQRLFETRSTWFANPDTLTPLHALAAEAGLTTEAADKCLADQALLDRIMASSKRAADEFGVDTTPTFFVNGSRLEGEDGIKALTGVVDATLAGEANAVAASGEPQQNAHASPPVAQEPPGAHPDEDKPSWFSSLWGSKKSVEAPPVSAPNTSDPSASAPPPAAGTPSPEPPTPASKDGPTIKVEYAGENLVLIAPPGMCFTSPGSELVKLLVEKVLNTTGKSNNILAGYKECDTPENSFRSLIGVYFAPDATIFDYLDDQKRNQAVAYPVKICGDQGLLGGVYSAPSGTFDDQVAANLDEGSRKIMADPHRNSQDVAIFGTRGNSCNSAEIWALGNGDQRRTYASFSSVVVLKNRLLFFSDSSLYSGGALAKQNYERVSSMLSRLQALNGN
jgi:protein-disulfide isomerase